MSTFFTRPFKIVFLFISCFLLGMGAMAQTYTATNLETATEMYSAITHDNAGNIYVVRPKADLSVYEVVKYIAGNPATGSVIYSGLSYSSGSDNYPWGITVDPTGNVFVINSAETNGAQIIKLAAGTYTSTVMEEGGYYTAITHDAAGNIYTLEYAGSAAYKVQKYAAGFAASNPGTVIHTGIDYVNDFTYPWGLIIDSHNNIYYTTNHQVTASSDNGGNIIKLAAGAYGTAVKVQSGNDYLGLALDASDNIYTVEATSGFGPGNFHYDVRKYADITTTGTVLYSGLTDGEDYTYEPIGLTVSNTNGHIYANDIISVNQSTFVVASRVADLTPPAATVTGITRNGAAALTNATSVIFKVTFSSDVSGVSTANFLLGTTGSAAGTIASVTAVNGSTYNVTVNGVSGDGFLNLAMVSASGILPAVSNVPYTTGESYTLDHTAPTITSIDAPASKTYKEGDVLNFVVHFGENVTADVSSGTPTLPITIGTFVVGVPYASGSGTQNLTFSYTILGGENDNDGIATGTYLVMNSGTLRDAAGNDVDGTFHNVGSTAAVLVDTDVPTVALTSAATSPINAAGAPFNITITFSEAVQGFAATGITITNATISNFTTSDNTVWTAKVTPTADGTITITVPAGAAHDAGPNNNTASNTLTYTYDGTAPVAPVITGLLAGSNPSNSATNTLTGTAEINSTVSIYLGGVFVTTVTANGSGAWTYATGTKPDGSYVYTAKATDAAGNVSVVSNTYTLTIDTVIPTITSVSVPANGTYKAGTVLTFVVNTSENVIVDVSTGTPVIPVTIGATTIGVPYASGSGTSALTFSYTVVAGENDNDGITIGSNINLNGGTIQDAAKNNLTTALNSVGSTAAVFVDTDAPSVVLSSAAANPAKAPFTVTITFSEPVSGFTVGDVVVANGTAGNLQVVNSTTYTVLITPSLDGGLTINVPAAAAQDAATNPNTASNTLSYTYDATPPAAPVITGLLTGSNPSNSATNTLTGTAEANSTVSIYLGGVFVTTVTANGSGDWTYATGTKPDGAYAYTATATDAAGNVSPLSNTYTLTIDTVIPTITSVDVPANATYKAGTVLTFVVHTSENINVDVTGGTPVLPVTIGVTTVSVPYASGTGTNALTFTYTVVAGENDNDGIAVGTNINLNGGTIQDAAHNNLNTTLNSTGSTANVFVDTDAPTVVLSSTAVSPINVPFTVKITFSETVSGFTASDITVTNGAASGLSTSDGGITYTATITPTADGAVTINVPAAVAQDVATNPNTASNTLTYNYDATPPNAPVITGLQTGSNPSNSATNTLTGTAEINTTIKVYNNGVFAGTTTANGSGDWTFATGTLTDGTYPYTATATDAAGNVSAASSIYNLTIDLTAPTVTSVGVPANGTYKAGTALTFTVDFSENVNVTGTPQLPITIGSTVVNANYVSGTGTGTLTFTYNVVTGDNDADGIAVGNALTLNGGTIKDAAGNNAVLTLNSVGSTANVFVDTDAPTVVLSSTAVSPINVPFTVKITFSEAVSGFTASDITVTNGAASNLSTADGGITYTATITPTTDGTVTINVPAAAAQDVATNPNTASNTLTYNYDVTPPNAPVITGLQTGSNPSNSATNTLTGTAEANSTVTVYENGVLAGITTANGSGDWTFATGTLTDGTYPYTATATDAAGNVSAASSIYNLTIDLTAPTITSVGVPANGTYKAGTALTFTVNFSENVNVTGTPQLPVTIGSTVVNANYVSGSGTGTLTFTYNVVTGDNDADGIAVGTALVLNGGTIKDAAGNNAVLTLNSVGSTTGVFVDTDAPSVVLTSAAVSPINAPFTVTITFSEAVTGFTASDIIVATGTASNLQTADGGITYTATITPAADGTVTINVPAAVAQDVATNPNTASNTLSYIYDATAPTITSVSVPASKTYVAGEVLTFTTQFSEPVTITGTPSLNIVIGTTTHAATMVSSTATSATYTYTVQSGDADADGITLPAALSLNGGTIKDAAGNNANLTLNNVGNTSNVKVDAVAPVITLNQSFTIVEDSPVATSVGVIAGNDPAGGGTLQNWTFVSDDAAGAGLAAFALNAATGAITVSNTANLDLLVNQTITFQVTVSDGYNISNTTDVKVKIVPKFQPPTDIILSNNTVNERSPLNTPVGTLSTVSAQPGVTFTYSLVTGAGSTDNAAFNIVGNKLVTNTTLDYATKPTYTVRIKSLDNNGLSVEKAFTISVNFVNQAPVIDVIPNASVCANTDAQVIQVTGISPVEAGQTYTLGVTASKPYFDQLTITPGTGGTAVISYTQKADVTGPVFITVTVTDDGGTANGGVDTKSTTFTITIATPPVISITSDKGLNIDKGDIVHLTATSDDASQYTWTAATGIIGGENTATLTVRPLVSMSYEVTVTNSHNCKNTQSIALDVSGEPKQNALNILTPNGDGKNDRWIVLNIDLFPNNEVKIYDRAGRLVYHKKVYTNDWDGTVNGEPLAEGTYYYIIDYGPGEHIGKGYITIIRDKY